MLRGKVGALPFLAVCTICLAESASQPGADPKAGIGESSLKLWIEVRLDWEEGSRTFFAAVLCFVGPQKEGESEVRYWSQSPTAQFLSKATYRCRPAKLITAFLSRVETLVQAFQPSRPPLTQ